MGRAAAGNSADPARLARMMDAKRRLIGVDVEALNAQVAAKAAAKAEQAAAERHHADATAAQVALQASTRAAAVAARRAWDRQVQEFRDSTQGKATGRDWDLSRPDDRRLESPARLGNDDDRCGAASLQCFEGEDLAIGERVVAQQEQCKAWWDAQVAAKAQAAAQKQQEKQELAATVRKLDTLQGCHKGQEAVARAELARRVAAANAELAQLKAADQAAARQAQLAAELAELQAAMQSAWLNEDPNQATSQLSPARVRTDSWKGASPQQRQAVLQQQAAQVEERRAAAAAAAAADAAAAAAQGSVVDVLMQQALNAQQLRRQQAAAVAQAQREQMAAKAARDAALRELYANKVSEDYFARFGTSHR